MKKRILSLALAIAMIISLLPAVTVLTAKAATVSGSLILWGQTFTVDNDETDETNPAALYWVNNGTDLPKEWTTEEDWNYSFAIINDVPTLTLKNASYDVDKCFLQLPAMFNITYRVAYEGTNNIIRAGSGAIIYYSNSTKLKTPKVEFIGASNATLNLTGGQSKGRLVYFSFGDANPSGDYDSGPHILFRGGTVNITRTVAGANADAGALYLKSAHLTVENCNFNVNNMSNSTTPASEAVYVANQYYRRHVTIRNSTFNIETDAYYGLYANYSTAKQLGRVFVEGNSTSVSIVVDNKYGVASKTCAGVFADIAYIRGGNVTVKATSDVTTVAPVAFQLVNTTYNYPILTEYDGTAVMYTTEGGEPVTEYTASSYFKLESACKHTNTQVLPETPASCTATGLTEGVQCTDCGLFIVPQEVIPEAHTPAGEAQCRTDVLCTECGGVAIPATGHDVEPIYKYHKDDTYYQVLPTCTEPGQIGYKQCKFCKLYFNWSCQDGDKIAGNSSPSVMSNLYVAPTGHTFEANETVETGHKCIDCDETAHDLKVEMVEGDAVNHKLVCQIEICEYSEDEAHNFVEGVCACGFEEPAEHVHEYNVVVEVVAPTCKEEGYTIFKCACDEGGTQKGAIQAATSNHDYSDWANGKKTCSVCQDVVTCEHETVETVNKQLPTCGVDGYTGDTKCKDCGLTTATGTVDPATGEHVYGEWTDGKQTCSVCQGVNECKHTDTQIVDAAEATCGNAGYTGDKVCNTCKETVETGKPIDATGNHAGGEATCKELAVCGTCGQSYGKLAEHKFVDGYCSVCELKDDTAKFVAEVGGKEYTTLQAAIDAATEGQTITLIDTVVLPATGAKFNKDLNLTLNLNGQTITSIGDAIYVTAGTLTINGDGNVNAETDNAGSSCAVWTEGGNVIINGGTYTCGGDPDGGDPHENDLIYAKIGTIKIYGGRFEGTAAVWALNENDTLGGTLLVYGGEFVNFDPAYFEKGVPNKNLLADKTQHTVVNGNVYTICKGEAQDAVKEKEVPATCTAAGSYDEVVKCSCGKELSRESKVDPQKAHDMVYLDAEESTCKETGLTAGQYCKTCNTQTIEQEETAVKAHTPGEVKIENYVEGDLNTYTKYQEVIYCSACGTELSRKDRTSGKVGTPVAEIDGFKYATLEEAIAAAVNAEDPAKKTVKLLKDFANADEIIITSGEVVIDFNGFFYEVANTVSGAALYVGENATVTLINTSKEATDARLAIKYAKYADFDCVVKNDGVLKVGGIRLNGANLNKAGAATIINNKSLTLDAGAVVTINANTKTGIINNGTVVKGEGEVDAIEGFHWTEGVLAAHDYSEKKEVTFEGNLNEHSRYNLISYCSVCEKVHSVKERTGGKVGVAYARIGEVKYASLQAAIDAAQENDEIVLLKKVADGSTLVVNKNVKINLNGFEYSVKTVDEDYSAALVIKNGAEVEIYNGTLRADYSAWKLFDSLVKVESGKLVVKNATLNANNVLKAGAVVFDNADTVELTNVTVNASKAAAFAGNEPVVL